MNDFLKLIDDYASKNEDEKLKINIIEKLKEITDEFKLSPSEKINILKKLLKIKEFNSYCLEAIWKIRDSISHIKGYDLDDIIDFLVELSKTSDFLPHERIVSTVILYNHGYISKCYDCFKVISSDDSVDYKNRIEAAKFLFASDDDDNQEYAQTVIIEIIDLPNEKLSSEKRYKIITEFLTKSGIRSFLNNSKLRIPYNEEFVYGIQIIFFYNPNNGIREKILSGQHLLQMECVDSLEKLHIENYLLDLSLNKKYEQNIRADAADVVLRLSSSNDQKLKAREIIGKIGFEDIREKSDGNLLSTTETLYTNSQNVHEFTDQIDFIVEKLIKENISLGGLKFENIHDVVSNYARSCIKNREDRYLILKSLNRIAIDTATFTKFNSTLGEIFTLVWLRIDHVFTGEVKEEVKKRVLQELIDMGETCSSGHISRIINALCVYDDSVSLKISWSQQIISNFVGRLNAKIRDYPDEDVKYSLTVAGTDMVTENDREIYRKFIENSVPLLEKELYEEFVLHNHVSKEEFEKSIKEAIEKVVLL